MNQFTGFNVIGLIAILLIVAIAMAVIAGFNTRLPGEDTNTPSHPSSSPTASPDEPSDEQTPKPSHSPSPNEEDPIPALW
ncbi:hypothetical protein H6S82_27430 [Planktothrix sp. FACHB-1355]|uniref:Uncharacterized protein n=1 Tax=Aerosakkonema funiforme FACHB-1375 TaxID=2949571 RepID=A0A926VJM9_9CYAN|nr:MULTISPECIES: hypothetical protein [Oscillatoriales]MBD2184903.1 hypothetical protein [Aerosakkonema funiforme FACHB-1375]MBD3562547.1 hypothetical protein [Planktothrix sp. FACHB-1355]